MILCKEINNNMVYQGLRYCGINCPKERKKHVTEKMFSLMCLTCVAFFLDDYRHANDVFDDDTDDCFQFQEQRFQEYEHNFNAKNKDQICFQDMQIDKEML